ncbi:hypothetical protein B5C34_06640 [Pacificimonas flava]|uniref:Integrase catalytic domain-containing protein n=2 Tax=Pacificimonas TaxID=1960290 RepID=A0A219B4H7_9SPHN|nr:MULTISPECIES: hypothetical protein [Pacificimonas]MBZ6377099.1 hypothetical protein [Pacificimonas aurantium]OWV33171.1 hypothetical protein B5C34_06640 [Pacificimonas flava]
MPAEGLPRASRIDSEIEAVFESCTNRYYRKNRHISLRDTYNRAVEKLCTSCVFDDDTGAPITFILDETIAIPTFRQFSYWYGKQKRAKSDAQARLGDAKFALRSRARLSFAAQDNENAGGRYVIDSTKLDVNLVARHDRRVFIGTPVLYVVVDEFTGLIIGFSVSLEEASWLAAGLAILNCLEDKSDFCRRHSIEIDACVWATGGMMPMRFLFDRGEARGDLASGFVAKSGIIVENTGAWRADLKGVCEKRFDLINCALRSELPGARDKDSGKRGERDPREKAVLNLDEIVRILVFAIIHLNGRELTDFRQTRAMIADGVPPISSAMWEWAVATGRSALQRFEPDELAVALMPMETGTITAQGVRFKGLYYTGDRAEAENWFAMADAPGFIRHLSLSYHPLLADAVYLHIPGEKKALQAVLTPYSQSWSGMSFDEIEATRRAKRISANGRQLDQIEKRADFRNQVQHVLDEAARERLGNLRPRDLKDARTNKALEREDRRLEARREMRSQIGGQPIPARGPPAGVSQGDASADDLGEGMIE